jgi:hypothetical protein
MKMQTNRANHVGYHFSSYDANTLGIDQTEAASSSLLVLVVCLLMLVDQQEGAIHGFDKQYPAKTWFGPAIEQQETAAAHFEDEGLLVGSGKGTKEFRRRRQVDFLKFYRLRCCPRM